ncbi:hypothetical protein NEISICOT_03102 [Neisseria sicca ATCC 29256]|uniref:Uncharacterized protein n=1 Tax=Neisseria sicca ATCC 29256 TaxID=547045 RepID=C6M977_NEISI|nr:hypothetical protein NEISICOT_03102 [Neisseria sicca ATCC 29256]
MASEGWGRLKKLKSVFQTAFVCLYFRFGFEIPSLFENELNLLRIVSITG